MNGFARSLRANLEKATNQGPPWGDANPLVVIGLTEAILELGLTESQIYPVVRSFVRQLAAQVHPDRKPVNVSADRQREIMEALDFLDDQDHFVMALKDFRELKAEDRHETSMLRKTVTFLRDEIARHEQEKVFLEDAKKLLEKERADFLREKKEDPPQVPRLKESLAVIGQSLSDTEADLRATKKQLAESRRQFEGFLGYVHYMASGLPPHPGAVFAFDARWIALASFWSDPNVDPSPIDAQGSIKPFHYQEIFKIVKKKAIVEEIIASWKRVAELVDAPEMRGPSSYALGLGMVKLKKGWATELAFGHRRTFPAGGRIVGSVPPQRMPVTRSMLVHQPAKEGVLASLTPWIVPGGFLASVQNLERDERKKVPPYTIIFPPRVRISTKRIVLAVG